MRPGYGVDAGNDSDPGPEYDGVEEQLVLHEVERWVVATNDDRAAGIGETAGGRAFQRSLAPQRFSRRLGCWAKCHALPGAQPRMDLQCPEIFDRVDDDVAVDAGA